MEQIQWDGGIQSAQKVYEFIGRPFEPILAYSSLVDGQPVYDPLMGGPILRFTAKEGDMWLEPGDWIVKGDNDFKLIRTKSALVTGQA